MPGAFRYDDIHEETLTVLVRHSMTDPSGAGSTLVHRHTLHPPRHPAPIQDGLEGRISGDTSPHVGEAQSFAATVAELVEMQLAGHWRSPDMPALVRTLSIRRPSSSCCGVPTGTVEFEVFRVQRSRDPGMPIQLLDRDLDRRPGKFTTAAVSDRTRAGYGRRVRIDAGQGQDHALRLTLLPQGGCSRAHRRSWT